MLWINGHSGLLCPKDTVYSNFSSVWPLTLTIFIPPFGMNLKPCRKECNIDVPLVDKCSTDMCSLFLEQLWVSALTPSTALRTSGGLRVVLTCRYRDRNLEASFILCLFSKIIVIDSYLGPVSSPTKGSGQIYHGCSYSCGVGMGVVGKGRCLNPVRKCLVNPLIFMPLLYLWAYLDVPDVSLVHSINSWVGLDFSSSSRLHNTF